jgi:DNA-binding NtrC family response regulator
VRELRNVVERAVLLSRGDRLGPADFAIGAVERASTAVCLDQFDLPIDGFNLEDLNKLEVRLLRQALERTGNNQVQAAQLLHVTRDRFRYRLQKYGLI